jgi:hypothetical protein
MEDFIDNYNRNIAAGLIVHVTDQFFNTLSQKQYESIHDRLIQHNWYYELPMDDFIKCYHITKYPTEYNKEYDIATLIELFDSPYIENCYRDHLIMRFADSSNYPARMIIAAICNMQFKSRHLKYLIEYVISDSDRQVYENDISTLTELGIECEKYTVPDNKIEYSKEWCKQFDLKFHSYESFCIYNHKCMKEYNQQPCYGTKYCKKHIDKFVKLLGEYNSKITV